MAWGCIRGRSFNGKVLQARWHRQGIIFEVGGRYGGAGGKHRGDVFRATGYPCAGREVARGTKRRPGHVAVQSSSDYEDSAVPKAGDIVMKVLEGRTRSESLGQEVTGRGTLLGRARSAINLICGGCGISSHDASLHVVKVHFVQTREDNIDVCRLWRGGCCHEYHGG